MYFHDRAQAGQLLASNLASYRGEPIAVVALSPGGLLVGEQIALQLHASLNLLLTSRISAPGDDSLVIGTMDQTGLFTYNSMIAAGQMEEYLQDMRTYMEEEKLRQMYHMTTAIGANGMADPEDLRDKTIIIATDGVKNGMSFDAALHYLGRIRTARIVAAIPVGPAETIDRLSHIMDRVECLYIPDNFFTVSHYYTDEDDVNPDLALRSLTDVQARWR